MKRFLLSIPFAFLGGVAGFVVTLVALLALAVFLSWWHDDPAAGGVLSFLVIPLVPIGTLAGMLVGVSCVNLWYTRMSAKR